MRDEFEVARNRRDDRRTRQAPDDVGGTPTFVGQVASNTANIAINHFLAVTRVDLDGAECEGCAGTTSTDATDTTIVLLIGTTSLPVPGDQLICRFVDSRWVAEKGKPASVGCPATIHLQKRSDGTPIAGATITLSPNATGGTLPSTTTGTTDSSGNWTLPSIACSTSTRVDATVTYDGVSFVIRSLCDSSVYCTTPIKLCYCKAVVNVTTLASATLIWTESSGATNKFTRTGSGGSYAFTYKELLLCTSASYLPKSIYFESDPQSGSGYKNCCLTVPVRCDDNLSVSMPLFYYATCYVPSPCCADPGCTGVCPGSAAGRNLTPKNIQVRCTTIRTGSGDRVGNNLGGLGTAGGSLFASDDGAWSTIPWVGIVGGLPTWDTGCRGAQGNFVGCPSGTLNGTVAGDTAMTYSGTRIIVQDCNTGSPYDPGVHFYTVKYLRYGDSCPSGSVSATSVGGVSCPVTPAHSSTFWIGSSAGAIGPANACLVSPLDATVSGFAGTNTAWSFEVRELACSEIVPIDPGDPTVGSG